jgi:hypothetical protein
MPITLSVIFTYMGVASCACYSFLTRQCPAKKCLTKKQVFDLQLFVSAKEYVR